MQVCSSCTHDNAPERGYCGACGHMLRPVCRRCRFANDRGDRFCGGCGLSLATSTRALSTGRLPVTSAATANELDALFAVKPEEEALPSAGIGQDDLDRLFGGAG